MGVGSGFGRNRREIIGGAAATLICVSSMVLCCVGAYADGFRDDIIYNSTSQQIKAAIDGSSLAKNDIGVGDAYYSALRKEGDWSGLIDASDYLEVKSAGQALDVAMARYAMGDSIGAERTLITELEREPHNVDLFAAAKTILSSFEASSEVIDSYNEIAARSNEAVGEGLSGVLKNQLRFELIRQ